MGIENESSEDNGILKIGDEMWIQFRLIIKFVLSKPIFVTEELVRWQIENG